MKKKYNINWNIDFKNDGHPIVDNKKSQLYKKVYSAKVDNQMSFYIVNENLQKLDLIKLKAVKFKSIESGLLVSCIDVDFHDIFEELFIDIFNLMEKKINFQEAYNQVINNYSAFLNREKLLSKEEQIGLIGELSFLKNLLEKDSESLDYWIDKNEDFNINSTLIEVKTTRSKEHKHIINGLSQLTVLENSKKYILSHLIRDDGKFNSDNSINLFERALSSSLFCSTFFFVS